MSTTQRPLIEQLLESNFTIRQNELCIGGLPASELAARFGTPLYVYDAGLICCRLRELRAALPNFDCYYSIKANPTPSIVRLLHREGCGMELASEGELEIALACGCSPKRILFAGPGKTDGELRMAIEAGIEEIHVESLDEIERIERIATERSRDVEIALRINPIAGAKGAAQLMGGSATAFGMDEENLEHIVATVTSTRHCRLAGLHVFAGTQNLNAASFGELYNSIIDIALRIMRLSGMPLRTIDFGGGFGVPYFQGDTRLDLTLLAKVAGAAVARLREHDIARETRLVIEPGRFLTAESGVFLTKVVTAKTSRGQRFVVVDGGLNNHLPSSGQFGQIIKRNFPMIAATKVGLPCGDAYNLVGPLCTPLDVIGRAVALPLAKPGDLIALLQSGAYARTVSPHAFLSHHEPAEVMVENGAATLVRRRGGFRELVRGTFLDPEVAEAPPAL